jgi:hypothetical protein
MRPQTFQRVIVILASIVTATFVIAVVIYFCRLCRKCVCPQVKIEKVVNVDIPTIDLSTSTRDRRVLSDPLYPPLGRSNNGDFVIQRQIQDPRGDNDSFRLVGYLSSSEAERDAGLNQWKLFGRMKDRNQGEYYIIPANNNVDLKIPLAPEIVRGERLRDLYTLPTEMRFDSPMLNRGPYTLTEISKGDLGSRYL